MNTTTAFDAAAHLSRIEALMRARPGAPSSGKLVIRECSADDLPGLVGLVGSVGWQVTAESLASVMRFGEMWCLACSGEIVGSAGWIPHGRDCAWIVMVMTKPEWRKLSIATTLMLKVLERTWRYPERMLDASEFGAPVYRRLGFEECAKLHLVEVRPGRSPAPRFAWRPMRETDFPLPGTDENNPAHRYIFGSDPGLCRVLEQDGSIAAWFLGREKEANVQIGQIYAEDEEMAADAFHMARAMLPERTLVLSVPPETKLFAAVQSAGATPIRIHTRMFFANHPVPPFPPKVRSSAGPDFG